MKGFSRMSAFASVLLAFLLGSPVLAQLPSGQELPISYGYTISPQNVVSGQTFTLTLYLTNVFGFPLDVVSVTNTYSAPVTILSVSNSYQSGTAVSTSTNSIFTVPQLVVGAPAIFTTRLRTTRTGPFTNFVEVASINFATNDFLFIPLVVSNAPGSQADLAVGIATPRIGVLVNDVMAYTVTVSNLGPSSVTNAILTNTFPAGVTFVPGSSTNRVVGPFTLTNGATREFQYTLRPTNSGSLTFSATIRSSTVQDPNSTNSAASNVVNVLPFVTGQLIATNLTAMTLNPQNGLMEQTIRLVNSGTSSVPSARVIVTGLTTNRLHNAVGTNFNNSATGDPFVVLGAPLGAGQSADLVLEYVITNRIPVQISNSSYQAVAGSAVDLSVTPGTNGTFAITLSTNLPSGGFVIEFQSTPGASYTILYSTNGVSFTNPLAAQPSITAKADKTMWIDDGPPKTISPPPADGSRFYRVRRNP